MWYIKGNWISNTAAHRGAIQASCYPMTSKTNCNTIVFEKFCITTRTKKRHTFVCLFFFVRIRGLEQHGPAQQGKQQPSGLLLSARFPTRRNVYRGACIRMSFLFCAPNENPNLFSIGEGFGFFVFFGNDNSGSFQTAVCPKPYQRRITKVTTVKVP